MYFIMWFEEYLRNLKYQVSEYKGKTVYRDNIKDVDELYKNDSI